MKMHSFAAKAADGGASGSVAQPRFIADHDTRFLTSGYQSLLEVPADAQDDLRAALHDTLDHPGSLVRAKMAFGIATELGLDRERARQGAIAIEYFHTASLLFDDLPCMDDALTRRGHPCPHTTYGSAVAILAALAFINQAYALVWQFSGWLPPALAGRMNHVVFEALGPLGIVGGQALDLNLPKHVRDATQVLRIAELKTAPLIRMRLLLPALAARSDDHVLARLDRIALLWGVSYQIEDDFKDELMSEDEVGKTTARDLALGRPNFAQASGHRQALVRLSVMLSEAQEVISELVVMNPLWSCLQTFQDLLVFYRESIRSRIGSARKSA